MSAYPKRNVQRKWQRSAGARPWAGAESSGLQSSQTKERPSNADRTAKAPPTERLVNYRRSKGEGNELSLTKWAFPTFLDAERSEQLIVREPNVPAERAC